MNQVDPEIQSICDEIKIYAERKSGKSFDKFEAKYYDSRGELHSGIDFYIKVDVGDEQYVHIWVYRCAPQEAQKYHQLRDIQMNKTKTDPLLPWKPSVDPEGPWSNLSERKTADSEVQSICDTIKIEAEGKAMKTFTEFQAKYYYSEGDYYSGTNFFIKVHVGGSSYAHIWVYRCRPQEARKFHELKGIQDNKTESDSLLPLPWVPEALPTLPGLPT